METIEISQDQMCFLLINSYRKMEYWNKTFVDKVQLQLVVQANQIKNLKLETAQFRGNSKFLSMEK